MLENPLIRFLGSAVALASLLGATGNHPAYAPLLKAMGAADERDDVFASVCYFTENIYRISRLTTCSKSCMMKMIRDRKTKMRPHNTDAFLFL